MARDISKDGDCAIRPQLVDPSGLARYPHRLPRQDTIDCPHRSLAHNQVPTLPPCILAKLAHIPPAVHGNSLTRHVVIHGKHDGDGGNVLDRAKVPHGNKVWVRVGVAGHHVGLN